MKHDQEAQEVAYASRFSCGTNTAIKEHCANVEPLSHTQQHFSLIICGNKGRLGHL